MSRPIVLTLFSSKTCSLCNTAKATLLKAQKESVFDLKVVDIHSNECPKEAEKYIFDIPVVHLNDKFLVQHRVHYEELLNALATYSKTGEVVRIK
ncbi:hypothetical protein BC940DRAFT_298494 [Gongronella butleri]|nr:hypothetical protein BC940DRAFT_298494 [Gongronella butleri]